jgi:hypothetical protein
MTLTLEPKTQDDTSSVSNCPDAKPPTGALMVSPIPHFADRMTKRPLMTIATAIRIDRRLFCLGVCSMVPTIMWGQSQKHEYILMVLCDPIAGGESDFDAWWPTYLRSVAKVPGVTSAEDFRRAKERLRGGSQALPGHLAYVYISASDLSGVIQDINKRTQRGRIVMSPAVDKQTIRDFSYQRVGIWKSKTAATAGETFMQIVLANPMPNQEVEFGRWFAHSHGPELVTVAGVYQIERGVRLDVNLIPGEAAASPASLSAMRFQTTSVPELQERLELAAKGFTNPPSPLYDVDHAWRETYQRLGAPIPGTGQK